MQCLETMVFEMLRQIRNGIYSFNDEIKKGLTALAVHPFYRPLDRVSETNYRTNFEKFLLSYEGNILTLESYDILLETAGIYQKIGKTKDLYFVATERRDPKPKKLSWKILRNFLSEISEGDLLLLGGFYFKNFQGCLGRTEARLKKYFDISILAELTFNEFYDLDDL